jgi:hypothetical protein
MTAAVILALAGLQPVQQEWVRRPAPGIEMRMIVQADPARTIYALRFLPGASFEMQAHMARNEVYDATPAKGRDSVSNMVIESGALGGVNGDFFQFGEDPGGDPTGLHMRAGEILSLPDGDMQWVWSRTRKPQMSRARLDLSLRRPGAEPLAVLLNERVDGDEVVATTSSGAWTYGSGPFTAAIIDLPKAGLLFAGGTLKGVVARVVESDRPIPVRPGQLAVSGMGRGVEKVKALVPGMEVELAASGDEAYSWADQGIGGGPELVRAGRVAVNRAEDPRHPRTAVGTGADGSIWHVIVDGRQAMSAGASLKELAEIMLGLGCDEAFNLDGGGSSTLNLFGVVWNRPSGGIERLNANGIMFFGERPAAEADLSIQAPGEMKMGDQALAVAFDDGVQIASDDEGLMWSCQGAAWIDQSGRLRAHASGKASLTAWYRGSSASIPISVSAP